MSNGIIIFGFAVLAVLLACIAPLLALWSINTILEQSGVAMYIPHQLWTYIPTLALIAILRGK